MNFKEMKKKSAELAAKVTDGLKQENQFEEDKRFWYPGVDKAGNSVSIIRFLPASNGEDQPYVRLWTHEFKGPGGWYIENCRSTIKEEDPVNEYNTKLWDTQIEKNQNQARDQKRQTRYFANVLVIKDPINPANDGQVKIFKFGPGIFKFIKAKLIPEFEGDSPVKVFDLDEGANFRIKIRKDGEYRSYDRSEFDSPSALFDGDEEKQEAVWLQQHALAPFIAPDQFKSYDELKKRLNKVLKLEDDTPARSEQRQLPKSEPRQEKAAEPARVNKETASPSEDDDLSFFQGLVNDDDDIPF